MIARVAALEHQILFGLALDIAARQVVEQNVKLCGEEFTLATLPMLLQFRLVRQQPVQAAIQARVVDRARRNMEQIFQRRRLEM